MREIKFRAWQKHHKRMLEVRSISFKDEKILSILTYTNENVWPQLVLYTDEYKSNFWLTDEEGMCLHLMQFTGLLDKNGKEIYEGDICIMHMPNTWGEDDELSKEVPNRIINFEWKNNGWNLKGFNILTGTYYFGSIKGEMLEVIGNVYQNPELLNK